MSKIGKKAIAIPSGVNAAIEGQKVRVKGPKGELAIVLGDEVAAKLENNAIAFSPRGDSKRHRAAWGTARARVNNLVQGVTKGYEKKLEITGVGYRAQVAGKKLTLALGYSHEINYDIPDGINIVTPKPTEIVVSGIERQKVGQVAAEIREFRPPEPYKGKGIRYSNEYVFRKEGKKK
jgi:large subunit ribosomal protein L6